MIIAVAGIDGAGKTTSARKICDQFRERGIRAFHLDLPRFTSVPFYGRVIALIMSILLYNRVASRRYKSILLIGLVFLEIPVIWAALVLLRRRVIVMEHHPKIDLVPYGTLYGGAIGGRLAGWIANFFPGPEQVLFLENVPLETAMERIQERNGPIDPHETMEKLAQLRDLLSCEIQRLEIPRYEAELEPVLVRG